MIPLNIPNSLTILRILLIPVFVGFLVYDSYPAALCTLLIAAITDALDGTIARLANQSTQLGAYLDPLADKLLLMSSFVTLAVMELVPVWGVILVVSRDAILLTGTLLSRLTDSEIDCSPSVWGKMTTFSQILYILVVVGLAAWPIDWIEADPILYVMTVLTVISGLHYLFRGLRGLQQSA